MDTYIKYEFAFPTVSMHCFVGFCFVGEKLTSFWCSLQFHSASEAASVHANTCMHSWYPKQAHHFIKFLFNGLFSLKNM
jgi:hypothetical protein